MTERTTVRLPADLLKRARRKAAAERRTLTSLIEDGLRSVVAESRKDVNVLIYAFRKDMPQHGVCRAWLAGVVTGEARFALSTLVLGAVVRITTNPRAFKMPSAIEEAFGFCDNLLG